LVVSDHPLRGSGFDLDAPIDVVARLAHLHRIDSAPQTRRTCTLCRFRRL